MSGFGFGGFGSNNNPQQQGTGFGGFGSNNNTGGGFGQTPNTGFGNNNNTSTGGGLFGSNSGGFGSGGFGSTTQPNQPNQTSLFGAAKPFGATSTSSGGLFGNSTATAGSSTGFGGFGATNPTANTSSPFGGATTGGGLFGSAASKPAFGTGGSSGGLFGAGGFGTTNSQPTGAFGAPASTALSSVNPQTDGTGSTPFQPFTEKESGSAGTNHFQSISFMQPYQKFSFEELRLADYAQGRRYGNGSGQAGAFGTSTGFGGFGQNTTGGFGSTGNTGGGLFGASSANNSSSPFGAAQTTNTGFGNNSGTTGGGLFGAKPAGGGLFGATTTTSSQPSGGLFGTTGSTGFGSGTGTGFGSGSTGGGLFGSNTGTQGNNTGFKLGGATTGGFGQSNTGAFGQSNTTSGGGLFGNTAATSSPFGGGQQQAAAANPFGGFGQTQNQGSTTSPFGGFGNSQSQQKPGGLFGNTGATNTGAGLFGSNANNQQQQPSGGLFGNTGNNQQTGGGLFGNKPATSGTGGGLFGNLGTNNTSNTGGSLFSGLGNTQQNQPNQGGGLFGNNQQQDKPGGLFGQATSTTNNTGGGLFGNLGSSTNNPPTGNSSLFGNLGNNNPNPQPSTGGLFANNSSSMLGDSQQNQQQGGLLASLTDQNPYGHQSIFSGLPPPSPQNVGPIATPLSTGQKMKKSAILPQYKINPNAASRLVTPQKRGYGFTYSTYGTPTSISSAASTPGGLSSSLLGGSFGRSLGKSLSTSNLRRTFDSDSDSILAPGAFSANSLRYSNASLKRLTIDRNIRTDLFGSQPLPALPSSEKNDQSKQSGILKKKVSFDSSTVGGNGNGSGHLTGNDQSNGAMTRTEGESATPSAEEQGFLRSSSHANGNVFKANGTMPRPEMEQVKGNELAIVHEDGTPEPSKTSDTRAARDESLDADPEPGEYYMKPSREELRSMSRDELKHLSGFIVGRQGCGYVRFDEPVDLTTIDLDNLYEKIAKITTRSITVYPVNTAKPPRGKGLNVPATLTLENCWPRTLDKKHRSHEKSGTRFDLHVRRLKGVKNTNFVKYDKDRGEWVFTVPHFTTYQLDYSDEPSNLEESALSAPPYTPTPVSRTSRSAFPQVAKSQLSSHLAAEQSPQSDRDMEDHVAHKNGTTLPGAYDNEVLLDGDVAMDDGEDVAEERPVYRSQEDNAEGSVDDEPENDMNRNQDQRVTGPFPRSTHAEIRGGGDLLLFNSLAGPKSILKGSQQQSRNGFGTPFKAKFDIENDWAEQLQRTVSPRKQDRQALRERQATILKEHDENHDITPAQNVPINGAIGGFTTSIDLMKSLFGRVEATKSGEGAKQVPKGKGFEWPYTKKPKTFDGDQTEMVESDQAFHDSQKPSWGADGTLIYAMAGEGGPLKGDTSARMSGSLLEQKDVLVSEGKDIRFVKFATTPDLTPETLARQRKSTSISTVEGVPYAEMSSTNFDQFSQLVKGEDQRSSHEKLIWELAHILFDEYDDDISGDVPKEERMHLLHRIRKERLSNFWRRLVQDSASKAASTASTAEERAVAHLSGNNIEDACDDLLHGKDFRLATLVAQIGGDQVMRDDMGNQINEWRRLNVLSEITEPIRALYELLAGNTCVCEGKKGSLEDRARTFVMSERFGLDWRRAFGLRLWYAIDPDDAIEEAVHKFIQNMESGDEEKKPLPWFVEQGLDTLWIDEHTADRSDLLWGLLKLFADRAQHARVNFADIVMPENVSRNPTDTRLSFQLYHALSSSIRVRDERTADQEDIDLGRADQLAWGFISQLEAAGEWLWAVFAALHLSNKEQRQKTLQSLLAHHADQIGQASSTPFRTLRDEFKIPEAWIWEAKALYARSAEQDHVREVQYLLKAKNWTEAHKRLCRTVAPRAIIEQDYQTLWNLLGGFEHKESVKEWSLGGQVFQDFIALVHGEGGSGLKRLLTALPAMVSERPGKLDFVEMVAVKEMSGVVGKKVLEGKRNAADGAKVLQLPLTEDAYLKHTLDLSLQYYRAVMAGGS